MMERYKECIDYIIDFLLDGFFERKTVFYGKIEDAPTGCGVVIVPSTFFTDTVYGQWNSLPEKELELLDNVYKTPVLYGVPRCEKKDGKIILYADIIASSYYMMSRYEELIKKNQRDTFGRFLGKDALVFQCGYGMRPIVDEYGEYLRDLVAEAIGEQVEHSKMGFRKIYLTHDVDAPFLFDGFLSIIKQYIKNMLPSFRTINHPLQKYYNWREDPYYTFSKMIQYDAELSKKFPKGKVESIYFLITRKSTAKNHYCNINMNKYQAMLEELAASGATLGLHVSHEGGIDASVIGEEVNRLPRQVDRKSLKSRHHYLRWTEPEQIDDMERAGIKEDFTLGYADTVGFRVGTCKPYRFMNPANGRLSNVIIHPMEVMECTLDRSSYMNLSFEEAVKTCEILVEQVYKHNGELNILFHNSSFIPGEFDYEDLYKKLLAQITKIIEQ